MCTHWVLLKPSYALSEVSSLVTFQWAAYIYLCAVLLLTCYLYYLALHTRAAAAAAAAAGLC
jgi:hypothetical protein